MNKYKEMKEQVKNTAAEQIVRNIRSQIENKLPEGKNIENVSDEQLEKALEELKSEVDKP